MTVDDLTIERSDHVALLTLNAPDRLNALTQDMFERQPLDPPSHHVGELVGCARGGDQQPRLVLGEDTPGGAQAAYDVGIPTS